MTHEDRLYIAHAGAFENDRLRGLPLVIALSHPQDAGGTAGHLGEVLLHELDNVPVIEFDADRLHDYRSRKPRITFKKDHYTNPVLPELKLYAVEDRLGKPFLLLTGAEPDLLWQRFTADVVDIAQRLEVSVAMSVTGFPMPVPHTRPIPVTAHGSRKDLTVGISSFQPEALVPGSVSSLLEVRLTEAGIGTAGFAVNVPQYLSESELPQTALVAMEHLSLAAKLSLPSDRLRELSENVQLQIDEQASASPEIQMMIQRLEESYDANAAQGFGSLPLSERAAGRVPSRDEIGDEVEAFLAQLDHNTRDADGDGPRGLGPSGS
ncbi:PAC2 family protein [Rothia sp. SD9660Na]|uniref:proteasome assembly chaperone family protein n=1 Tax=Rothia sp. SD9660Na TaxID=3047030 RepID=UPI0024B9B8DC|nr:PAC2 family protein [Rothia sp. SD9660Na]WHS49729.1 PAC2 family protein [Rothia sp. SD9660Na]